MQTHTEKRNVYVRSRAPRGLSASRLHRARFSRSAAQSTCCSSRIYLMRCLQDFKEAARLAAEAKAKAAEADAELSKAEGLREQAAGLSSQEAAAATQLDGLEQRLTSAQRSSALANWRQLKVS